MVFLLIAKIGDHGIIPIVALLITSLFYMFTEFQEAIIPVLSIIGLCLVLFSLVKKNNFIVIIGYLLTYFLLYNMISNNDFQELLNEQLYFIISISLYLLLSLYIIFRTLKEK